MRTEAEEMHQASFLKAGLMDNRRQVLSA